jgi:predicted secreted Zn-dependent protease
MKFLLTYTLLILSAVAYTQTSGEEYLKWSASKKLTWNDYKAQPRTNTDAVASTTTVLSIDYKFSTNSFGYKIESRFSKTRSWGLHKTDYILSHEQGHFDIAEIFARKLHKQMSEYNFNRKTYQKDLKKIYEEITEGKEEMQNDYDKETRHSINKQEQAEWLKKIERLLKEYEPWADY